MIRNEPPLRYQSSPGWRTQSPWPSPAHQYRASGVIFAAFAVAHVVRLITGFQIVVGNFAPPWWMSIFGALVAGALAIWMVVAARRT